MTVEEQIKQKVIESFTNIVNTQYHINTDNYDKEKFEHLGMTIDTMASDFLNSIIANLYENVYFKK